MDDCDRVLELHHRNTMSTATLCSSEANTIVSDSGRLTFFEEMARSQERLELPATNTHQTISQWLLFAKKSRIIPN